MNPRRLLRIAGLIAAIALFAHPAAAESEGDPVAPSVRIDELHVALLDVMKGATVLGYSGRAEKLKPVVPEYYDVAFMAEKSVGRQHWKKATPSERQRFLDTFQRFMIANYAGQFDGFSGQSFKTHGEEAARKDTMLVRSVLINPKDDDVELNYRMRQVDGKWKIIDVYLDGIVSELALRRSEFAGIVKRENFDSLIAAIDARILALATGT